MLELIFLIKEIVLFLLCQTLSCVSVYSSWNDHVTNCLLYSLGKCLGENFILSYFNCKFWREAFLERYYSKCGLWTSNISITLECVRNAECRAHPRSTEFNYLFQQSPR